MIWYCGHTCRFLNHAHFNDLTVENCRKHCSINCNLHRVCSLNDLFTDSNSDSDHIQVCLSIFSIYTYKYG